MNIVAKCPQCDAGLPVNAADAPPVIKCGGCGRDIPLAVSEPVRTGKRLDRCPVCGGAEFYGRKDFDPKVGLTVVIIGDRHQRHVLLVQTRPHRVQHPRCRHAR